MSKRLGKAIKEKRELLGYSQDALAFELNVTQAYISLIEKGEKKPTVCTLNSLAAVLEIDIKELVDLMV